MLDTIKVKLNAIKNPVSGQSLEAEKRWNFINLEGEKLVAEYNRDGISPADKRVIEKEIQGALEGIIGIDNIMIKTVSTQSQDVFKAIEGKDPTPAQEQAPAQLKVGHGTIDKKKAVPNVNKIIAIGSGKGGVGKSTFTANLALSLSRTGKKVGVIDADIYGPSMPMMFGQRTTKPRSNGEKKILPIDAFGIKIMSFGFFIEENDPVIWRGPMLGGVLNQFLFDVDWGELDYLLIDLPPGTGDIQLSMIQNAHVDASIVISTPQDIALLDAKKGAEMFKKLNLPIIGMVENMSSFICTKCNEEHFIFGKAGVESAVEQLGINFLGQVPLEIELRTSADKGEPYMSQDEYSDRAVFKAFEAVAQRVNEYFNPNVKGEGKSGFFSKILGLNK